ncbi:uncharacterized protein BDFB_009513, partial [Asbolus verrucosus]
MTSTPNDSLNTSDQLMDLSIKNFWVIVHYPYSDPGSEFEILSKKDLVFDSWEVLERGAAVAVRSQYGNAKVQGIVVTVSDDYNGVSTNFSTIVEEYRQEYNAIQRLEKSKKYCEKYGNRSDVRQIIKVADKETQTDSAAETENIEYMALKRQFEELQIKYDGLKETVTEVKSELQGTLSKLNCGENEEKTVSAANKGVLQPTSDNVVLKENTKEMVIIKTLMRVVLNVQIGSGGTKVARHVYNSINWTNHSAATRKLLTALFSRNVLASHSLTGKPSPAFISSNKQTKMRLNPTIISDIIEVITRKCAVSESLVRNAITTKCADENKMYKKRLGKRPENDENSTKK